MSDSPVILPAAERGVERRQLIRAPTEVSTLRAWMVPVLFIELAVIFFALLKWNQGQDKWGFAVTGITITAIIHLPLVSRTHSCFSLWGLTSFAGELVWNLGSVLGPCLLSCLGFCWPARSAAGARGGARIWYGS